jgi:serine/threonine protein kinase
VIIKIVVDKSRTDRWLKEVAALSKVRCTGFAPRLIKVGRIEAWPWFAYARLPGIPWSSVYHDISEEQRGLVWSEVGKALRRLHEINFDVADEDRPHLIYPEDCLCRRPIISMALTRIAEITRLTAPGFSNRLIHRDISPDNVIVRKCGSDWKLSGIVDFELATVGDPAEDLAMIILQGFWNEPELFSIFFDAYTLSGSYGPQLYLRVEMHMLLFLIRISHFPVDERASSHIRALQTIEHILTNGLPRFVRF